MLRKYIFVLSFLIPLSLFAYVDEFEPTSLRAPAYPLLTIDPYTSVWSFSSEIASQSTKHWTGRDLSMIGAVRVDGKTYRIMGKENDDPNLPILPLGLLEPWTGRFTTTNPGENWNEYGFNDKEWSLGKGVFASADGNFNGTIWETDSIWIRREFDLSDEYLHDSLFIKYLHDDLIELYINGELVLDKGGEGRIMQTVPMSEQQTNLLKKGRNIIAAKCINLKGGSVIDFGIYKKRDQKEFFPYKAEQKGIQVSATQTSYLFQAGPVEAKLTFTSPLLCDNFNWLSRPVNYMTYSFRSTDSKKHQVDFYFETNSDWCVNESGQKISIDSYHQNGIDFLKCGTLSQDILGKKGDDLRIDWGYFYIGRPGNDNSHLAIQNSSISKKQFVHNGTIKNARGYEKENDFMSFSISNSFANVGRKWAERYLMLGYDDIYSVQYFGTNLNAYWRQKEDCSIENEFVKAQNEYRAIIKACAVFNKQMENDAIRCGGKEYAEICALAYRQAISAHKLVKGPNNENFFFSKENFSNGSIGTVDITYPSSPLFLCYNTELVKAMMNFIFDYSESGKWTKPFAAHDLGTYPIANGQTYSEDMPIEESGNMLILTMAIAMLDNDISFPKKHWNTLSIWADYLLTNGFDPESQLCTDDFAGHLAHNTNLSVKAILAIACYGKLALQIGDIELGNKYLNSAKEMARIWETKAFGENEYKLTFDKNGTWSQKYNLVWDTMFGLNIFPSHIREKELACYLKNQKEFGLPLDSRKNYTKSDWILWTATLASDKEAFRQFLMPVYHYINQTPNRIPLSDWHETITGESVGFRARSVVGGYFIKLLEDKIHRMSK